MAAEIARTKACIAHELEYGRHSPALAHVESWCQLESLTSVGARPVTEELLMAAFAEIYDEAVRLYGGEAGGFERRTFSKMVQAWGAAMRRGRAGSDVGMTEAEEGELWEWLVDWEDARAPSLLQLLLRRIEGAEAAAHPPTVLSVGAVSQETHGDQLMCTEQQADGSNGVTVSRDLHGHDAGGVSARGYSRAQGFGQCTRHEGMHSTRHEGTSQEELSRVIGSWCLISALTLCGMFAAHDALQMCRVNASISIGVRHAAKQQHLNVFAPAHRAKEAAELTRGSARPVLSGLCDTRQVAEPSADRACASDFGCRTRTPCPRPATCPGLRLSASAFPPPPKRVSLHAPRP